MVVGSIVMWVRVLFVLTLHPNIGPLLLTIRKMMVDIANFSVLLVVFIMGTFFAFHFLVSDQSQKPQGMLGSVLRETCGDMWLHVSHWHTHNVDISSMM